MITADAVIRQLNDLIASSNAATGGSDTNLTDAVASLISGFGVGAGGGAALLETGEITLASNSTADTIIELEALPDLFVLAMPAEDVTYERNYTVGAFSLTLPFLEQHFSAPPPSGDDIGHGNVRLLLTVVSGALSTTTMSSAVVLSGASGAYARFIARSSGYPKKAGTYRWASYKIWEG